MGVKNGLQHFHFSYALNMVSIGFDYHYMATRFSNMGMALVILLKEFMC
jgi:hypothetical protein